jgi:hypothetical protein
MQVEYLDSMHVVPDKGTLHSSLGMVQIKKFFTIVFTMVRSSGSLIWRS